jgi:hypothetical protein
VDQAIKRFRGRTRSLSVQIVSFCYHLAVPTQRPVILCSCVRTAVRLDQNQGLFVYKTHLFYKNLLISRLHDLLTFSLAESFRMTWLFARLDKQTCGNFVLRSHLFLKLPTGTLLEFSAALSESMNRCSFLAIFCLVESCCVFLYVFSNT